MNSPAPLQSASSGPTEPERAGEPPASHAPALSLDYTSIPPREEPRNRSDAWICAGLGIVALICLAGWHLLWILGSRRDGTAKLFPIVFYLLAFSPQLCLPVWLVTCLAIWKGLSALCLPGRKTAPTILLATFGLLSSLTFAAAWTVAAYPVATFYLKQMNRAG